MCFCLQEMMMLKLDGFANGDDVSGPGSLAGGCCFDFKKVSTRLRALASPLSGSHCTLHPAVAAPRETG